VATDEVVSRRPGGRRRGTTATRGAILDSARELFAARGYDGTTIRGIATGAQVDPALVHHFFGTKDALFATVMQVPDDVTARVPGILDEGLDGAGERLTRFYLGLYEAPATRSAVLATLRSAVAHEEAARILREVITARLLHGARTRLPDPAELRISLAMAHLTGLAIGRYVIAVPAVLQIPLDELVAWVAPAIQAYLTGPAPTPTRSAPTRRA
jgi:AcrR family transcriptional regulator